MSGSPPTSLDVARRAGVSQSAVSRTFTPGASVSEHMAEKVRRAALELGYRPNVLARSLITGRTRIIGLVVAHLDNQFYPDALEQFSTALQARGYHILIFLTGNSDDLVDRVMGELLDYQIDGIVMGSTSISNALARRCHAAGIPVVLFNRRQPDARLSHVVSDNRTGGRAIAEHLVACGHRRIAHISGWAGSSTGSEREEGFRAGLARHGLAPSHRIDGRYDNDLARAATHRIFGGPDRPEAVFVGNDAMAFAVMDALRFELGLRIPQDVAVVGYDDVRIASWPAYDLTTVRQRSNQMVQATVATLIAHIEDGDTVPRHVEIEGPLMVRGSTRPVGSR